MLHVTNGSVVVMRLHDLGLPGRALPWDDVLHEGPVRAGGDLVALRAERAGFLAVLGLESAEEIERHLTLRDDTLAAAVAANDEIVLWFEHDLYDQLQLLQVLDRLNPASRVRQGSGEPAGALRAKAGAGLHVTAILAGDYLGAQPPDRLHEWFNARQPVSAEQYALASLAWSAFQSPDPRDLTALCGAEPSAFAPGASADSPEPSQRRSGSPSPSAPASGSSSSIPHLIPALRRHLQQFPWLHTGLSRTEGQTLAAVAAGVGRVRDLFLAANHRAEDAVFMGDSAWWWHIRGLIDGRRPLLRVDGGLPSGWDDPAWWDDDGSEPRLVLTRDGDRVAAGQVDQVALNGIDRWLGGVHLTTDGPHWRWNPSEGTLVLNPRAEPSC